MNVSGSRLPFLLPWLRVNLLIRSITDEVRWHDTAQKILTYGLDLVVEFGASPVLGPLMKRLPNAPNVVNVADYAGVEKLRGMLGAEATA